MLIVSFWFIVKHFLVRCAAVNKLQHQAEDQLCRVIFVYSFVVLAVVGR